MKSKNTFKFLFTTLSLISLTLWYTSCKKDNKNEEITANTSVPDAYISGKVLSPSGKNIGSAEIIAGQYKTKSDKDGNFVLHLFHGNYNLIIQTGSGHVFKTELAVSVSADQTLVLPTSQTALKQIKNLAYIPGAYDKIETLIIDTLGYTATMISISDLSNLSTLSPYAAIFMNCGLLGMPPNQMDSTKYANLNSYISKLGSIYASDFAVECLTGDNNFRPVISSYNLSKMEAHKGGGPQVLATCISPLIGGFIADSSLCTLKSGPNGMVYNAHIIDADIINLLGKDSLDILYDLGGWEIISNVEAPFSTIISDNTQGNGPLAVKTDFDDENPGGVIFYTTFHNHPQGVLNKDVQNILQYFILNL